MYTWVWVKIATPNGRSDPEVFRSTDGMVGVMRFRGFDVDWDNTGGKDIIFEHKATHESVTYRQTEVKP